MSSPSSTRQVYRRTILWPGVISVSMWIVFLVIVGVEFVSVSQAAKDAIDGAVFPSTILGMPLFQGFNQDGRFGVHPQWGLLVLLIVPGIIGVTLSMIGLRHGLRRS